jgi:hypothetical protein
MEDEINKKDSEKIKNRTKIELIKKIKNGRRNQ